MTESGSSVRSIDMLQTWIRLPNIFTCRFVNKRPGLILSVYVSPASEVNVHTYLPISIVNDPCARINSCSVNEVIPRQRLCKVYFCLVKSMVAVPELRKL